MTILDVIKPLRTLPGFHLLEESSASWSTAKGPTKREVVRFTTTCLQEYDGGDQEFHLGSTCEVYVRLSDGGELLVVVSDDVQHLQFYREYRIADGEQLLLDLERMARWDLLTSMSRDFWEEMAHEHGIRPSLGMDRTNGVTEVVTVGSWGVRCPTTEWDDEEFENF